MSSQTCSKCGNHVEPKIRSKNEPPRVKKKKKQNKKKVIFSKVEVKGYNCDKIHGVRVCSTCDNLHWNRDVNAARNLLHMFQNGTTFRPIQVVKPQTLRKSTFMSLAEACQPVLDLNT
jgi:hypothetical protein